MGPQDISIAVLCPSEIARRRFLPALSSVPGVRYAGIGVATKEERKVENAGDDQALQDRVDRQRDLAVQTQAEFGGTIWESFQDLIESPEVNAVYIPLPPALHAYWAEKALCAGKHVMMEKPFTTSFSDAEKLVSISEDRNLAVHENYMFAFHSQIEYLCEKMSDGSLGDLRLIRIDFGFPFRGANDFRYSAALGGGSLLDCGGYALKLASMLLGPTAELETSSLSYGRGLEVDLFGSATLENDQGLVAQVSFGMDNDYRCDVDVWGSEATLYSGRILTAPCGFSPTFEIRRNGEVEKITLRPDDSFAKSIAHFLECINSRDLAQSQRNEILVQSRLVEACLGRAKAIREP